MADSWAVKYRPQKFSDIVGNGKVADILRNAVLRDVAPTAIFLAGTRGSGKCFEESQLVLTSDGWFKGSELKPSGVPEREMIPFSINLINKDSEVETTAHFYSSGRVPLVEVKTTKGFAIKVTPIHPLYVFDGEKFCWKQAQELQNTDFLCFPKSAGIFGNFTKIQGFEYTPNAKDTSEYTHPERILPEELTETLAELMGLFVGDACTASSTRMSWKFESDIGVDPDMEAKIYDMYASLFGVTVIPYPDNNFKTKSVRSKLMVFPLNYKKGCAFLKFLGVKKTTSDFKEVPWSILRAPRNIQASFLRGLFEADGWCSKRGLGGQLEVGYASASRILVTQIQAMLWNFGIRASVRARWNPDYNKDYWYLSISEGLSLELYKEIGFLSARKKGNLASYTFDPTKEPRRALEKDLTLFEKVWLESKLPNRSCDPKVVKTKRKVYGSNSPRPSNFSGLSESRITRILELDYTLSSETRRLLQEVRDLYWLQPVASVLSCGDGVAIDFELPDTHSFILQGCVSHNTSCARLYARALCCENLGEDGEPCGECDTCKDILQKRYQDVIELDAASENSVAGIRDLIKTLQYLPTHGKYKIVILDEVHSLTSQATNALLKTLEEPPEFVRFAFCTTEPHKVLETIRSRCLMFTFRDITSRDIVKRLSYIAEQEELNIDELALNAIAKNSNGGLRDAVMLMEQAVLVKPKGELIKSGDILNLVGFVSINDIQQLFVALKQGSVDDVLRWLDVKQFAPIDILTSAINFLETIIYIKQGVSPSAFVSKDQVTGIMGLSSAITFSDVMLLSREFRSIIYDLRNLSLVNTQTLFRLRILETMEKLNTNLQQQDSSRMTITASSTIQTFIQRVKDEFSPVRIPIPT